MTTFTRKGCPDDKLKSEQQHLSICLSHDPDHIINECDDILLANEYKCLLKEINASEKITKLLKIIINKGEDTCQRFLDILLENRRHYPQLDMFCRPTTEACPCPTVAADNSSVVTARDIGNVIAESLKMKVEVERDPGMRPSGSGGGLQADLVAQGGSVVCVDKISGVSCGDVELSVSIKPSHVRPGGAVGAEDVPQVDRTLTRSPEKRFLGQVKVIREHKVGMINCLMADPFILQHAHARGLIDQRQYTKLSHCQEPEKQITHLIDQVLNKGQETCHQFLELLQDPEVLSTYPDLRGLLNIDPQQQRK